MKTIVIGSKNTDLANDKYQLQEAISGEWRLMSYMGSNIFYNVTSDNNEFYLHVTPDQANAIRFVISEGYYTHNQLVDELQNMITAAIPAIPITITFNSIIGKYTFQTNDIAQIINLEFREDNSAHQLLGFVQNIIYTGSTVISANICDIQTHKYFYVRITEDNEKRYESKGFVKCSFLIPLNNVFGEMLFFEPSEQNPQFINIKNQTNKLHILFYDSNFKRVINHSDWTLVLENDDDNELP